MTRATKISLASPTIWLVACKLLLLAALATYVTTSYGPHAGGSNPSCGPRQFVDRSLLTEPRHSSAVRPAGTERKPILLQPQNGTQQEATIPESAPAEPQLDVNQPKSYFALCTIVKDQHQDLLEWIEWHRRGRLAAAWLVTPAPDATRPRATAALARQPRSPLPR
jgi:hypothetical protein